MTNNERPSALKTADLVRRAQGGDDDAREELFGRYAVRVLEIARMRLGKKLRLSVESTDIRQGAVAEALRRLSDFEMRDDSSLIRWLAKLVESEIRAKASYYRALKRSAVPTVPMESADSGGERRTIPLPSPLPTPSVEIGRAETADAVRDCIEELPERYREVILLRDYAGCSWEAVAEDTGTPSANSARMVHSRALAKLGRLLRERGIS